VRDELPDEGDLGDPGRRVRRRDPERVAFRLEVFLRLRRIKPTAPARQPSPRYIIRGTVVPLDADPSLTSREGSRHGTFGILRTQCAGGYYPWE
jgi:hypothetical protein